MQHRGHALMFTPMTTTTTTTTTPTATTNDNDVDDGDTMMMMMETSENVVIRLLRAHDQLGFSLQHLCGQRLEVGGCFYDMDERCNTQSALGPC